MGSWEGGWRVCAHVFGGCGVSGRLGGLGADAYRESVGIVKVLA